jgi:hypothetical protein
MAIDATTLIAFAVTNANAAALLGAAAMVARTTLAKR